MPAVSIPRRDLRVTRFAEGHKVGILMGPATGKGQDVVYLLGRGQPPSLPALLAQRMCCDVAATDLFPCPAVPPAGGRITVILLIAAGLQLGVFLTVPSGSQPGAARMGAWTFGLRGHGVHLLRAKEKPPQDHSRDGFLDAVLVSIILSQGKGVFQCLFVSCWG